MKRRHEFNLEGEISDRLAALAAKPGSSKTQIMTAALTAYIDRRGAGELEDRFKARLDRLSLQLGRIERDQQVVAETLALFVRYQFTVTSPPAETDRASRLVAQERFKSFVEQVSRRITGGKSVIDEVLSLAPAEGASS